MQAHHWVAVFGVGLMIGGPVLCFLTWAVLGREGETAISFSMLFAGLGFLVIWLASAGASETEDEETQSD